MTTKLADGKGRIMLGSRFANKMFIINDADPGRIIITPAVAIPAEEAWLYENQKALNLLRQGLAQARAGKFSKTPPNLDQDASLVAKLVD
jgi:hypothetical protein